MAKVTIKIPALELDLPDDEFESKKVQARVAGEFGSWLIRYLPTWAWRKFSKSKYPQLSDKKLVNIPEGDEAPGEQTANGYQMIKPHSGEQLSDLLMSVAEVDPQAAKMLREALAPARTVLISLIGHMQAHNLSWNEAMGLLEDGRDAVAAEHGLKWKKSKGDFRLEPADPGDLVIVLVNKRGSYLARMVTKKGSEATVKFVRGSQPVGPHVLNKDLLKVGAKIKYSARVTRFDKKINQREWAQHDCNGTIKKLCPDRGAFVSYKDPWSSETHHTWTTNWANFTKG